MPAVQLESALTCPFCGHHAREQMRSTLASSLRQHGLRRAARPAPGDCCVFCSFGTTPCPPRIGLPDPSAAPVRHGQAGCRSQASVGKAALSRALGRSAGGERRRRRRMRRGRLRKLTGPDRPGGLGCPSPSRACSNATTRVLLQGRSSTSGRPHAAAALVRGRSLRSPHTGL